MKRNIIYPVVSVVLSLGVLTVLAGCGGDDNNDSDLIGTVSPTPSPVASSSPIASPSPSASPVATDNQNVALTFSNITATRSDFTSFTNSNRGTFGTNRSGLLASFSSLGGKDTLTLIVESRVRDLSLDTASRTVNVNLSKADGSTVAAGDSFPVRSLVSGTSALVRFSEVRDVTDNGNTGEYYISDSGTVTVVSRTASQITLHFVNVRFAQNQVNDATVNAPEIGATMNGEVTANITP